MEELKDVFVTPVPESQYVKPLRLHYTQGGREKTWDMLEVHDSVGVFVFNVDRKVVTLVKQFRPAIYYNAINPKDRQDLGEIDVKKYPAALGITLEVCAGIIDDVQMTVHDTAKNEVFEEMGYDVPLGSLEKIMSYRSGVGVLGSMQTLYYCEVTDAMKVGPGGGVRNEIIELVEMTIPEAERLLQSPGPHAAPPSCLFALVWFLHFKAERFRKSFERYCQECKPKPVF